MILRISLFSVTALVVAAHFLREGALVLAAVCALAPLLFLIRRRWALVVLQLFAYFSAGVWATTLMRLVQQRLAAERPWITAAAILAAVTLLTLLAGALLNTGAAKDRYPRK